jgi:hypothetical protein
MLRANYVMINEIIKFKWVGAQLYNFLAYILGKIN